MEWLHAGPKKPKSRNRSLNRRGSKGAGDGDALDRTGSKQGGAAARTRPRDSNLEAEDDVHANPSVVTADSKLIAAEVHSAPQRDLIISRVTETLPLAPFVIETSLFSQPLNRGGESRRQKDKHTG